jgi:hypothetical protein
MKIVCLHGYFKVTEHAVGEIAAFNSVYAQDLVAKEDYYTFEALVDAPEYSVIGQTYLGNVAVKTYADHRPWEIFRQNSLVYNFQTGAVVPIASQTSYTAQLSRVKPAYYQDVSLYVPGSMTPAWQQITGYVCAFDVKRSTFFYSDIFYD